MLLSVIAVVTLISFTCGENPAVQVILNNKGLQYGKHVGAGWIQDKLKFITFPDISGDIGLSIFGTLHYILSGITITKCDFPEPTVEFYKNATGFKTSLSGLSVALTGAWSTHLGLIHDGGSFNMAVFSVDVTSVVELGKDPNGKLSVSSVSCGASVGGVDVQFHGGASWIFSHFVKRYTERVRSEIEGKICPYVNETVGNLEYQLQAMNVSFDVNQDVTLDLPLTGLPVIDASSLKLDLKGEFYSIKTHAEPPFKSEPFTMPEQSGYMLSVGLSQFTLNSASYGYFSAGALQAFINDSNIPPSYHIHLNTSSMGPLIPQLPKLFPGLSMNLLAYARNVPLFSLQPGAVALNVPGSVKAFAIQPNGTQTPLFTLDVDSEFSGKMWTDGGKLKGSMAMNNLTVTLVASEVGPFQTDRIETLARLGGVAAMKTVNEKLGKGVDLPRMKQAQLVNTVLKVEQGFIAVASDAQVLQMDRDFN